MVNLSGGERSEGALRPASQPLPLRFAQGFG